MPIAAIEAVIRDGLAQGTIERAGMSDFCIHAADGTLGVMLCNDNDNDIHFGSDKAETLEEIARSPGELGVRVHGS